MAREIINRQVNIYIQSGEAQKAYDALIKKEKELNAELSKTTDPKRMKKLRDDLTALQEPISRAAKKVSGELEPSLKDVEASARKLRNELSRMSMSDKGFNEKLQQYRDFNKLLNTLKENSVGVIAAQKSFGNSGFFSAAFWANLASNGIMKVTSLIGDVFGGAIQEALDADAATRRLSSTLDNLGKSSSFDRITRKAEEMAQKFRYLDNDDVVGVFNKLIDYGKLTEAEMNDLLQVIIDFAAKSQISLEESTSIIIKALEGNGKALKEFGISIKDTGDESDRLNIIMTTLKEKVDGAGESFQNSAKGGIAVARQELANLKEELGNEFISIVNNALKAVLNFTKGVKNLGKAIADEFRGKSGFISFALNEAKDNPVIQEGISSLTEQFINTYSGLQSEMEKQLGRKLNMNDQRDAARFYENQRRIVQGLRAQLIQDRAALDELMKRGGRGDQLEARDLFISIEARQRALDKILNPGTEVLGIEQITNEKIKASKDSKPEKKFDLLAETFKRLAEAQKNGRDAAKDWLKENEKALKQLMEVSTLEANDVDTAALDRRVNNRRLAQNELNVLTSRGKKRLDAQLQLLNEQERQELKSKQWTEDEKLLIEEKYRQRRAAAETEYQTNLIESIVGYAQQAAQMLSFFGDLQTEKENAELERDRRMNDQKKQNLDRRLKSGLITQLQYNKEIEKIDREQQKKEKEIRKQQFERQQRESIIQVLINGAEGISKTIAKNGMPAAIPWIIAQGVLIAAQVTAIAKQKPPQFARGGVLGGRSHNEGGNPILDGNGRKIAEIEKGEGIINRRSMADGSQYTVSGTPSQIASAINAMHGGVNWQAGARLMPKFYYSKPPSFNFPNIKKYYAAGGKFDTGTSGAGSTQQASDPVMMEMFERMYNVLASLETNGVMAYSIISEQEKAQTRLNAIRDDATIKG